MYGSTAAVNGSWALAGPTVTMTVAAGERVHVSASAAYGTTVAGGASGLDVAICSQSTAPSSPVVIVNAGLWGLTAAQNTRQVTTLNAVVTKSPGTYRYGMCVQDGTAPEAWNSNDWGYVTTLRYAASSPAPSQSATRR